MATKGIIKAIRSNVTEVEFLENQPNIFDVLTDPNDPSVQIEVISSAGDQRYFCFILRGEKKITRGTEVISTEKPLSIPVGDTVLGRAFDIFGTPQDSGAALSTKTIRPIHSGERTSIEETIIPSEILITGVRVIDFFTPILKGSKTGLVGGAGLGKTILLTELIHNVVETKATNKQNKANKTVSVFSAVGERSREAQELLENLKDSGVLPSTTMVIGQMGENPAVRFRTASAAATVAEHFRDSGNDVLFFIDNMYRYSQAGYELATLMRAIPSEEGYQPTLPSEIGTLHERLVSNKTAHLTTIEAIYLPSDDLQDYSVRSTFDYLDSYIVLSRDVYQSGRLPAVDLLDSNSSALAVDVVGERHFNLYLETKKILESAKEIERIVSLVGLSELSVEDQKKYKRSVLIQNYMTQNLAVAEPQTGRPGVFAQVETTLNDLEKILSGSFDDADPDLFLYVESIKDEWKNSGGDSAAPNSSALEESPIAISTEIEENQPKTDPAAIPMVLSDNEAKKIAAEKLAVKQRKEDSRTIEEKYKTTLLSNAEVAAKTDISEHLENKATEYTPTKMDSDE